MTKIKGLILLFLGVLLTYLAWENASRASLKAFGYELGKPPTFLLVYGALVVGFAAGWLAHARRLRKKKRAEAALAAATLEKQQS
jgi:TRAP-type C4-dicarboxylate transport system permease small subunit